MQNSDIALILSALKCISCRIFLLRSVFSKKRRKVSLADDSEGIHEIPDRLRLTSLKKREMYYLTITDMNRKKLETINQTDEYRLAMQVESALNSCNFDADVFAASIPFMHPTLQQNFYRLIKKCLKVMADDGRYYDDRNRASHEEARDIMSYLEENGRFIPHI